MKTSVSRDGAGTRQGIIVYFKSTYGFIQESDEFNTEFFFHLDNVDEGFQPEVGKRVTFETAPPIRLGQKRQAVNVRDEEVWVDGKLVGGAE